MESKSPKSKGWWWWLLVFVIAALVVAASLITLWKNFRCLGSKGHHDSGVTIVDKYAAALSIAMQFFDIQKSGKLVDNRIAWRSDSGLEDGIEANLDLSKGMYDAGDLVKFGFPMAFTATVLSWSILEYGEHMKAVTELEHARESVKWITDYLINAHPTANVLYIQVGDPEVDHNCWERPETTTERRPLTQINSTCPGTEVAAETAAAMASASLVFKKINSTYSKLLLKHAEQLFAFADIYQASYSISIPQVQSYYNSSGYGDELLWAASWLYLATGDPSYLTYVTVQNGNKYANWGSPNWFTWDNKLAGTQVLLSRVNFFGAKGIPTAENLGLQMYKLTADAFMCGLLRDSPTATARRTSGGLIWVIPWAALQYSVAAAFLAVVYSDYMLTSQTSALYCNGELYEPIDLRNFAISQVDYVLGSNPMDMSYLVGYGNRYPQYVHHRGASIPVNASTGCSDGFKWLNSTDPNPNVAVGALVGGPFLNESFIDSRNNSMQNEPTTYSNALFVALLSGLVSTSSVGPSFA
ncbi:Endoglucanase [Actinidia chinensis var. chinensis]|uniref:Endoglucanase n=1 Tax=Actinidia chinensis var. chinensis TaxID=1590841 RepID=A0A2R6S2P6_ACTCC|nr:Endoglucanase [Actinidia chinensis var. chinensis]